MGSIGVLFLSIGSILLIAKNVSGFEISGFSKNDCVPYNVFIQNGEKDHSVSIVWSTRKECIGFVQYGEDRTNLDLIAVDLENKSKSKEHSVVIEKLLNSKKYFFLINSQEQPYGNNGTPLEFILEDL